jgi:hypothetical protein
LAGRGPNPMIPEKGKTAEEELADEIRKQNEARLNGGVEGR